MIACRSAIQARRTSVPGLVLALVLMLTLAACQYGATTTSNIQSTNATTLPATTWAQLEQRPLHLTHLAPGSICPVTPTQPNVSPDFGDAVGSGPVYVIGMTRGVLSYSSAAEMGDPTHSWGGGKVFWQIRPEYLGLVLIRGLQLDGTHMLRFNGGVNFAPTNAVGTEPLLNELRLKGGGTPPSSWSTWVTFTRVQSSGCYAYQVDGATFSQVIVFQAQSI